LQTAYEFLGAMRQAEGGPRQIEKPASLSTDGPFTLFNMKQISGFRPKLLKFQAFAPVAPRRNAGKRISG
jgi:hypothetical protein